MKPATPLLRSRLLGCSLGALLSLLAAARPVSAATETAPLRFGFSSALFAELAEADAHAVLKVWCHIRVALPVFFGRVGACLITHASFRTMTELNPQIGSQLKIVARSPALVTAAYCFRADFSPDLQEAFMATLRQAVATPSGRQLLGLFHLENVSARPIAELADGFALLDRHQRLLATPDPVAQSALPVGDWPSRVKSLP